MSARSVRKGKRGEREVVRELRRLWPGAERDLEQVRGENNGRDVVGCAPWCGQIKRAAKVTPGRVERGLAEAATWVGQTVATDEYRPVVIHRSDRAPWRVSARLSDLVSVALRSPVIWGRRGDPVVEVGLEEWLQVCADAMGRALEPREV